MSDQEPKFSRLWDSDEPVFSKPPESEPHRKLLPEPPAREPLAETLAGDGNEPVSTTTMVKTVGPAALPEPPPLREAGTLATQPDEAIEKGSLAVLNEQVSGVPRLVRSEEEDETVFPSGFFEDDDEPFDLPGAEKLGIVGGKGVGKSYLFQAMVYRTYAGPQAGALSYYLDGIRLFRALRRQDKVRTVNLASFVERYVSWDRLPQTIMINQEWYRLRLRYRTGLLGQSRAAMDVEFFDGSGEGFFQGPRTGENKRLWQEGYQDARVMVFCLPLWVAFPGENLTDSDWKDRDEILKGFEQVVQNYMDVRGKRVFPVKSVLALTMADDRRSALEKLYYKWIAPYLDSPYTYLGPLRKGKWVARYLANARQVSEALHEEFASSRDPRVASIPYSLDFGGRPWLIPVSAIEGEQIAQREVDPERAKRVAPVPVHVELPLLVALCERNNALM